jgi:prevent-host-death family protein
MKMISAKELRASLPAIVRTVSKGGKYTVIYRSRPAFRIVPIDDERVEAGDFQKDSLYKAAPVGRSSDGLSAADHDSVLYK